MRERDAVWIAEVEALEVARRVVIDQGIAFMRETSGRELSVAERDRREELDRAMRDADQAL